MCGMPQHLGILFQLSAFTAHAHRALFRFQRMVGREFLQEQETAISISFLVVWRSVELTFASVHFGSDAARSFGMSIE